MNPIAPEQMLAAITSVPSLPAVVTELMADLQGETVDMATVAHKIALDPALTARLLQLANSSFYGLPRQVASVSDAVAMLGMRNVRSVVAAAAVMDAIPLQADSAITFESYWRHGVATALCAQAIAEQRGLDAGSAYVAGLLHDIGCLVLATRFCAAFQRAVDQHRQHGVAMVQAEQAALGFDHTMVGAALATHWKFPAHLHQVITQHHDIESPDVGPMVRIVHLANKMAHALVDHNDNDHRLQAVSCAAWQDLQLGEDDVRDLFTRAEEALTLVTWTLH